MITYKKSSFKYWFAHWSAFQMTALNLGCWKWKYLLHDVEKPWLLLILKDYKKVQYFHRKNSKHHPTNSLKQSKKIDWEEVVIDWECSRFTKSQAQLNARETMEKLFPMTFCYVEPILKQLKL